MPRLYLFVFYISGILVALVVLWRIQNPDATTPEDLRHFGLEILYPAVGTHQEGQERISVDIIAIHGLNGHRHKTWAYTGDDKRTVLWLKDLLPQKIPNARIMTFGYNAKMFGCTSTNDISDNAEVLLREMLNKRELVYTRPIVFVGHSMGGIIIKRALRIANNDKRYRSIAKNVNGIVFFGTPHRGSDLADWANMVKGIASVAFYNPGAGFVENLASNSKDLMIIAEDFRHLADQYSIISYWEGDILIKPGFRGLVVPKHSAHLGFPLEVASSLGGDHSTMCQFSGLEDPRFETVWRDIRDIIGRRQSKMQSSVYFLVPFSRNKRYIQRSQNLAYLKDRLVDDWTGGHKRLALFGLGGVGKTQDVLEFVYEYYEGSEISVFWINARNTIQFEMGYRKVADRLRLPGHDDPKQDILTIVKNWFEGPESGDWIIVLDNADNKLDFFGANNCDNDKCMGSNGLAKFIPQGSKGTVIVTTRDREVADQLAGVDNALAKKPMHVEAANQLFKLYYPKAAQSEQNESVLMLLKELQYLPLAIVQAATFLRLSTQFSPADYLKRFNSTRDASERLLSKSSLYHGRDANAETIFTTFSITFEQIQRRSRLASSLLKLVACIEYQGIPHDLLVRSGFEGSDDEFTLDEAITLLINFSILTAYGRAYDVHSLVHLSIKISLTPQEMSNTVEQTTRALARILPQGDHQNWPAWRVYLPHASGLIRNVKVDSRDTFVIYNRMSSYFLNMGHYHEAEDSARRSATLGAHLFGQQNPDTLTSMANLASTFLNQGRWKEAEELFVQVVETRKRVLGQEHPDTLTSMANLALTFLNQGRWKEAEELFVQVVETFKMVLGQEHPATLTSMANLALTFLNQGRWKEAEELFVQVVETFKRVLGQEHPDTLTSMANLALTFLNKGQWKEAEELFVQVVETFKGVLGQEHPDTLTSMANLAWSFLNQARWKEAEELFVQVVETFKRILGQEHPDTLTSMANLASTFRNQGRWKEAEELFVQVVETRERVF